MHVPFLQVERELKEVEAKAAAISSASAEAQRECKVIQAVCCALPSPFGAGILILDTRK